MPSPSLPGAVPSQHSPSLGHAVVAGLWSYHGQWPSLQSQVSQMGDVCLSRFLNCFHFSIWLNYTGTVPQQRRLVLLSKQQPKEGQEPFQVQKSFSSVKPLQRYFKSEKWLSVLLCQSPKLCHFMTKNKYISANWSQLSFTELVTFWIQTQRKSGSYEGIYDCMQISMCLYIKPITSWVFLPWDDF